MSARPSPWEEVCLVAANESCVDLWRCSDRYTFRIRCADGSLHAPGQRVYARAGVLLRQPAGPLPHPSNGVRATPLSGGPL
jgi:hypothetical protein